MTTSTQNAVWQHSTDAQFRTWATALSNAIKGAGLVQTTDTGQINLTTAVRAAANASAGYEMFRFNDAMQSSAPVFIKVEYGTSSSLTTYRVKFTIGTATDGAGNFVGNSLALDNMVSGAGSTTSFPTYACHTAGYFGVRICNGAVNTQPGTVIVERVRDTVGAPTSEGLVVVAANGTSGLLLYTYFYATAQFSASNSTDKHISYPTFTTPNSLVVGTSVLTFPIITLTTTQSRPLHKSIGMLFCSPNDFVNDVDAAIPRYDGVTHTYKRMNHQGAVPAVIQMLWE